MSLGILLGAFFVLSGMGVLSAVILSERRALQSLACVGSAASLVIWTFGALAIAAQNGFTVNLWSLPPLGCLTLSVDRLSGLFLLVSASVFLLTSIYSLGYLRPYAGQFSIRALCACYFALYAAVVVVLTAGDVFTFLVGWESDGTVRLRHDQLPETVGRGRTPGLLDGRDGRSRVCGCGARLPRHGGKFIGQPGLS